MKERFAHLRDKLIAKGVPIQKDHPDVQRRHTYRQAAAWRLLDGQASSLEILAGLMGNSPQVCWHHYGKWWARVIWTRCVLRWTIESY